MKQVINIELSIEELSDLIDKAVDKAFKNHKEHFQPKEPTEYLTREQVATMLHIDLSSLHNWRKRGVIKAHGIEGRVLFKRSEIEQAVIELKVKRNYDMF